MRHVLVTVVQMQAAQVQVSVVPEAIANKRAVHSLVRTEVDDAHEAGLPDINQCRTTTALVLEDEELSVVLELGAREANGERVHGERRMRTVLLAS